LQIPPTASAGSRGTVTEFITKLRVAETPRIAHKLRKGKGLVSLEMKVTKLKEAKHEANVMKKKRNMHTLSCPCCNFYFNMSLFLVARLGIPTNCQKREET